VQKQTLDEVETKTHI